MKTKQYRECRLYYQTQWKVSFDNEEHETIFETIGIGEDANTEKALQVNVQLKEMRKKKI